MKRWLTVVTPAVLVLVVGFVFVVLTDRDPRPLPPLPPPPSLGTPSPSPVESATGPTGIETVTGPTAQAVPTGPTRPEEKPTEGVTGDADGSQDPPVDPPSPSPTATLELVVAKGGSTPQAFTVAVGSKVILVVTTDDVTDRVVVGDGVLSAEISPTRDATLTFSVDEPGEVRITLEDAGTVIATITVG